MSLDSQNFKLAYLRSMDDDPLNDFYILEKWIDYAKGIKDPSAEIFFKKAIVYPDIYRAAKLRREKFNKVYK